MVRDDWVLFGGNWLKKCLKMLINCQQTVGTYCIIVCWLPFGLHSSIDIDFRIFSQNETRIMAFEQFVRGSHFQKRFFTILGTLFSSCRL